MLSICFRLLGTSRNSDSVVSTAAATVRQVMRVIVKLSPAGHLQAGASLDGTSAVHHRRWLLSSTTSASMARSCSRRPPPLAVTPQQTPPRGRPTQRSSCWMTCASWPAVRRASARAARWLVQHVMSKGGKQISSDPQLPPLVLLKRRDSMRLAAVAHPAEVVRAGAAGLCAGGQLAHLPDRGHLRARAPQPGARSASHRRSGTAHARAGFTTAPAPVRRFM